MTIPTVPTERQDEPDDNDPGVLYLFVFFGICFLALMGYAVWPEVVVTARQFWHYESTTGSITAVVPPDPRAADKDLRPGRIHFDYDVEDRRRQAKRKNRNPIPPDAGQFPCGANKTARGIVILNYKSSLPILSFKSINAI